MDGQAQKKQAEIVGDQEMPAKQSASNIPYTNVLSLLDEDFRTFADGVADGKYLFWVGAGVSRGRMPPLWGLVADIIEYLRTHADFDDETCPYNTALRDALALAKLSASEQSKIDLTKPFLDNDEDTRDAVINRLCSNYSQLLQIEIDGKPEDALLWEGMNAAAVYGNPDVAPDAEHYCLAALVNEGALFKIASANWDCLIEKAAEELNPGQQSLAVCLKGEDFQASQNKPKLIKFHGCAKRALENEDEYRSFLVASAPQISGWMTNPKFQPIVNHLALAIGERPSLVLGLSVQDANLQALFAKAKEQLSWQWPGERPSYVFAEETLQASQITVLKAVYGEAGYTEQNRTAIQNGSHVKAFAGRLLVPLLMYVVSAKLERLARLKTPEHGDLQEWVATGIKAIRNAIAMAEADDASEFVKGIISNFSGLMSLAVNGTYPEKMAHHPLTQRPISEIEGTPEILSTGLPEVGILLGILGRGVSDSIWKIGLPESLETEGGMATISSGGRSRKLFVVRNYEAEYHLESSGRLDREEASILLSASPRAPRMERSSGGRYGRTQRSTKLIQINLPDLVNDASSGEMLLRRFRQEVVV